MQKILRAMKSSNMFENVQPVLHAKVPIIRSRHRQLNIEIDISLHNMLVKNLFIFILYRIRFLLFRLLKIQDY
jgi:DNA polymerase sigma